MKSRIKKIALVIPKFGLTGGAEHFAYELAERLSRNPLYDIHVFANKWQSDSRRITFHTIPIISFPKFLTTISFAFFSERKLSKMNFDVVHAHDRLFNADLFTMHGIPHRIWVREVRRKRMSLFDYGTWWVEKSLVQSTQCKMFLAVSSVAKDSFIREYTDVDPGKVRVVPPGVDAGRFRKADRSLRREEIRRRHRIDDEDCVILFVSMNFHIKGLDRLIPGIAKLQSNNQGKKIKLLVVGKGNEKKYGELAKRHGVQDMVIFAGVVERERINDYYAASDLFAMLSRFDTFGMVVLEAMASSLPVVISGNVGAKDVVTEGQNGFIIRNSDDADEISKKLEVLLDKDMRTEMGQRAFETASEHSWDAMARHIEDLYAAL